jgi:hypothetical protein
MAKLTGKCANPVNEEQISFGVFSDLPITHSDLSFDDVPRIFDLLKQIMDYCIRLQQVYSPHI